MSGDIHAMLIEVGKKWLCRNHPIVISELATSGEEPDVIGWRGGYSTLIECKASLSDFHADKNKRFRQTPEDGIGNYRYFLTMGMLLNPDVLPTGWGLIEVSAAGRIRVIRKSEIFLQINDRHEKSILMSTLRRIGANAPNGCSIKCYTIETKKRATLGVEK